MLFDQALRHLMLWAARKRLKYHRTSRMGFGNSRIWVSVEKG